MIRLVPVSYGSQVLFSRARFRSGSRGKFRIVESMLVEASRDALCTGSQG